MYIFSHKGETDSVRYLFNNFNKDKTVSSLELVEELCKIHPRYANGKAETFPFKNIETNKEILQFISKTQSEWKNEIFSLYNKEKIKKITGRLTIFALSLIDKKLAEILMQDEFLSTLINEIREKPYESLLNEDKKQLWNQLSILLN